MRLWEGYWLPTPLKTGPISVHGPRDGAAAHVTSGRGYEMNIRSILGLVLIAGAAVGTLAIAKKKKAASSEKKSEDKPEKPKKAG